MIDALRPFASGFVEVNVVDKTVRPAMGIDSTNLSVKDYFAQNPGRETEFCTLTYNGMGIYESTSEQMADEAVAYAKENNAELIDAVVEVLCRRISYVGGFILAFVMILILLTVIGNIPNISFQIPNHELLNDIGGAVAGLAGHGVLPHHRLGAAVRRTSRLAGDAFQHLPRLLVYGSHDLRTPARNLTPFHRIQENIYATSLCARCHKNMAVVFINRIENGQSHQEDCVSKRARELHIKPIDDIISKMGINDEDLDGLSSEMMEAMQNLSGSGDDLMNIENDDDSSDDDGKTATFPFLNRLFGAQNAANAENRDSAAETERPRVGKDGGERKPKRKFLDNYCISLTDRARAGKLDRMIGRSEELERVIQILNRRQKNNPCLIGEPGVGKTAIAEVLRSASPPATCRRSCATSRYFCSISLLSSRERSSAASLSRA